MRAGDPNGLLLFLVSVYFFKDLFELLIFTIK